MLIKIIKTFFFVFVSCGVFFWGTVSVLADGEIKSLEKQKTEAATKKEDTFELIEIPIETIKKTSKWMERQRDFLSDTFYNSAVGLDTWMGGERTEDVLKEDESYIRVRLRSSHRKSGERESDAHIKMRLDLPNTRRRVKLFFE